MLKHDFKDRPGEKSVEQGKFYLLNDSNRQQVIRKSDWERGIFPDTKVVMSMILSLVSALGEECPRSGCMTRGERLGQQSRFFKWSVGQ